MRKILISLVLITILSGCTFWEKKSDFTSLYRAYVVNGMQKLDDLSVMVGYNRHERYDGALRAAIEIPVLMSGSFTSKYDIAINNTDMQALLEDFAMSFVTPISSGSIQAKKIGLTSITGDVYLLMDELSDSGVFPEEAKTIFQKYNNIWLSYTQQDVQASLSGASSEDIMASDIAKNISLMGIKDIEKYLTEYPIWKSTGDLGMSGGLQRFSVELDRSAVLSLVKKATQDITGSGMAIEDETSLNTVLTNLTFSGTIGFDPKDAEMLDMDIIISQSGTPLGQLALSSMHEKTEMRFASLLNNSEVHFLFEKKSNRNDLLLTLSESGTEMGRVTLSTLMNGKKLQELSLDATAQGVSLSLKHTQKDDGSFEGRMTLPVGALTWTGKLDGKKLETFSLKGAIPMGSIDMSLIPSTGGMLRGPLIVKSGEDEIFRANVGLLIEAERMAFDLAIQNPEGGDPTLKTSFDITHKHHAFDEKIAVPTPHQPLQNMIDELQKLIPPSDDVFSEEVDLDGLEPIDTGTTLQDSGITQ